MLPYAFVNAPVAFTHSIVTQHTHTREKRVRFGMMDEERLMIDNNINNMFRARAYGTCRCQKWIQVVACDRAKWRRNSSASNMIDFLAAEANTIVTVCNLAVGLNWIKGVIYQNPHIDSRSGVGPRKSAPSNTRTHKVYRKEIRLTSNAEWAKQ